MRGTSKTDSVHTPKKILVAVRKEFGKFYDPVPYNPNFDPLKHKSGLTTEWRPVNFVNPPYSNVRVWFKKAHEQWQKGRTIIMLVKLATLGTQYAKKFARGAEVRVYSEKIAFPGYAQKAAFTNILIIWRARKRSNKYSIM
jgi:site-specific DNA-methyltransferase (adenine-specific)